MKDIQIFNVRYRDDIYGVKAIIKNDVATCVQIKYQVAVIYEHQIKGIMETKLANDAVFRKDFLHGFIVHIDIPQEGINNGESKLTGDN